MKKFFSGVTLIVDAGIWAMLLYFMFVGNLVSFVFLVLAKIALDVSVMNYQSRVYHRTLLLLMKLIYVKQKEKGESE